MLPSPTYRPLTLHHKGDCLMDAPSKQCCTCSTAKASTEFNKHAKNKDGLQPACRACQSVANKAWRTANPEKANANARAWKAENKEHVNAYDREWYANHKEQYAVYEANYRAKHPDRIKAKSAVNYAIKTGVLTRPDTCSACSKESKVIGHHTSYHPRFHLDVVWLCQSCHKLLHSALNKQEASQ